MASKPLNNVQSTSAGHYSAALKQHSTSRGYQYCRESTNKAFANRPGALDRVNIIVKVFKTKLWVQLLISIHHRLILRKPTKTKFGGHNF